MAGAYHASSYLLIARVFSCRTRSAALTLFAPGSCLFSPSALPLSSSAAAAPHHLYHYHLLPTYRGACHAVWLPSTSMAREAVEMGWEGGLTVAYHQLGGYRRRKSCLWYYSYGQSEKVCLVRTIL